MSITSSPRKFLGMTARAISRPSALDATPRRPISKIRPLASLVRADLAFMLSRCTQKNQALRSHPIAWAFFRFPYIWENLTPLKPTV